MNPVILSKIAKLTNDNEHTIARLLLAKHLGDTKAAEELRAIQRTQETIGYIDQINLARRSKIEARLLAQVEALHGKTVLAGVIAAL